MGSLWQLAVRNIDEVFKKYSKYTSVPLTMHQSVYTSIIRDLRLQVMSPGAQDSSALVTFPSGSTAYKRWVKSLFNHLIMHSSEWGEYARLGEVPTVVAELGYFS